MVDNESKNEIIIKEILHWKEAKLLPETHCDFLLALYTKGQGASLLRSSNRINIIHLLKLIVLIILMIIVLGLAFFIEINLILNIIILLMMIIGIYIHTTLNKNTYLKHASFVILLFTVFLITIHLSEQIYEDQFVTNVIIYLNFVGWFIISMINKLTYLKIVSILAGLFMTIYIVL